MQVLRLHIETPATDIPIYIGVHLWDDLKAFLRRHYPKHSMYVICDSNIFKLYSARINSVLETISTSKGILTFPPGERSKNRREKERLEDELLRHKAGRDSVLVAVGGGVCGDLAGFVAATFHRGIPLIQVPTSLMAQVDSSIGGKVGINHPAGKNLIGAFHQPEAIFVDLAFLQTLPREEFINGMAEVVKYAVTLDDELWDFIDNEARPILDCDLKILQTVIIRCIQLKMDVVAQDEKESGYRSVLNFGHTVGHAIEKLSGYQIKHGLAISAGMKTALRLSHRLLGFPEERVNRLQKTLRLYQLNSISPGDFSPDQIWETLLGDKKTRLRSPRFTLLNHSCQPQLFYPVQKKEFLDVFSSQN